MGQKVSPVGLRVGIIRDWESRWYAEKEFGTLLIEDTKIREIIFDKFKNDAIGRVEIERSKNRVEVIIRTARPGSVIGSNGEKIENLKKELVKLTCGKNVFITVQEIANPDCDAYLVAKAIAEQLEQRASFRTAQKKAIQKTMRAGAKGIKTCVSGRLGGADIARDEHYAEGIVPLHTLRADIDYAHAEAATTYGRLGVKVWICRGEVLPGEMIQEMSAPKMPERRDRRPASKDNRGPRRNNAGNTSSNTSAKSPAAESVTKTEGGDN